MVVLDGYLKRIIELLRCRLFDAVLVEKELLPWLPGILERALIPAGVPLILDFDDAVFHNYDRSRHAWVRLLLGDKLDKLMARADLVTVGNAYLGERATRAGSRRIERIPTVIDLDRYIVEPHRRDSNQVVVGWIGSPSTAKYLRPVSDVLERLRQRRIIRCVAIGARADQLLGTPFEAIAWTEETEVPSLNGFDIGIMPLPDAPWERGKCGYKLVQYMACGLPVVASPVGVNREIVAVGESGLLAETETQWEEALERLIADTALRVRMGEAGRRRVEQQFCLQVQGPRLAALMLSLMKA
jgi:glycosyltransferase involved in cell wall biosynthesis